MQNSILISKDKSRLRSDIIHQFLSTTYWAKGRTLEEVKTTIKNSICFGVFLENEQIGFARVVTDKLVFAYIMDVFILEAHRGNGYSKVLMESIVSDEDLIKVDKIYLKTSDAHGLYEQFAFNRVKDGHKWMERKSL